MTGTKTLLSSQKNWFLLRSLFGNMLMRRALIALHQPYTHTELPK